MLILSSTSVTRRSAGVCLSIADVREPSATTGGVNFVIGFRPELWRAIDPERGA